MSPAPAPPCPVIVPDWPAPPHVRAAVSTRNGGVSIGGFASLNLSQAAGDEPDRITENRRRLRQALALPREPSWLRQVHGRRVLQAPFTSTPEADASWTRDTGAVCAVLTADCLPVLFCDDDGTVVAVAHAGWRGLAGGVLEATIEALATGPQRLMAWLGPAIGPTAFEVGRDVRDAFVGADAQAAACFDALSTRDKFAADLYGLARLRLHRAGIERVYGGGRCTFSEPREFFSYRRDKTCGRQAALIWLQKPQP